jgi:hypothetical protein
MYFREFSVEPVTDLANLHAAVEESKKSQLQFADSSV